MAQYIEFSPQIGKLNAFVATTEPKGLALKVSEDKSHIFLQRHSNTVEASIPLLLGSDRLIVATPSITVQPSGIHLSFVAQNVKSPESYQTWFADQMPSADTFHDLRCRNCHQALLRRFDSQTLEAKSGTIDQVFELPSDNWNELKDLWLCSGNPFIEDENSPFSSGIIHSKLDAVLLGSKHLLIHSHNIDPFTVVDGFKTLYSPNALASGGSMFNDGKTNWHLMRCLRCQSQLGCIEEACFEGNSRNVQLWKFCVETPLSYFQHHTLETYVSSQILNAVRGTNTFKFVVLDESKQPHMVLSVMSMATFITSSLSPDSALRPALKLRYSFEEAQQPIVQAYENLYLVDEDVVSLQQLLEGRAELLQTTFAEAQRKVMQGTSYLHFIP